MDQKMMDIMMQEANDRMELLGIREEDINDFILGEVPGVFVDHGERKFRKEVLDEAEKEMIKKVEEEQNVLVYYVIKDNVNWPDGESFLRYTLCVVDRYVNDYRMVREDCIQNLFTLPAYIVNMDIPEYNELAEFAYRVIGGYLINVS